MRKQQAVTITRVGTNQKYSVGWESAFTGKKKKAAKASTVKGSAAKSAKKQATPKKKPAPKKKGKK